MCLLPGVVSGGGSLGGEVECRLVAGFWGNGELVGAGVFEGLRVGAAAGF